VPVWQPALVGPGALALVLTAAVLHALWNYAAKGVTEDRLLFIWTYAALSVAFCLPAGVVWLVLSDQTPQWSWVAAGALSALLHITYQLVLQRGYAVGELNVVYPLARGTGPLLTLLVAVTVLGERPGLVAALGVLLVVGGVLLISWTPAHLPGNARPAVFWGLVTGGTIAAYTVWDSHVVTGLAVPAIPYFVLNGIVQLPVVTVMAGRRIAGVRRAWPALRRPALVVALLSPLAYILVLFAMQEAPVSLVAAARESSIVVGALLGWLVLGEARGPHRLAGSAVVAVGIAAIVVG
jgi:drug/metabolite transporter (DMT)-like permease